LLDSTPHWLGVNASELAEWDPARCSGSELWLCRQRTVNANANTCWRPPRCCVSQSNLARDHHCSLRCGTALWRCRLTAQDCEWRYSATSQPDAGLKPRWHWPARRRGKKCARARPRPRMEGYSRRPHWEMDWRAFVKVLDVPVERQWRGLWDTMAEQQRITRAERCLNAVMIAVVWWCRPRSGAAHQSLSRSGQMLEPLTLQHYCRGFAEFFTARPEPRDCRIGARRPAMIDRAIRQGR